MKKVSLLILLLGVLGHAQINYGQLIKNIEQINSTTDINIFFEGVPIEKKLGKLICKDERFIRYHGIIVNTVAFELTNNAIKEIEIMPFLKTEDYENIRKRLTEVYGLPTTDHIADSKNYIWTDRNKKIHLNDMLNAGRYAKFSSLKIVFL